MPVSVHNAIKQISVGQVGITGDNNSYCVIGIDPSNTWYYI